ncbi:MAG: GAF domain-containing protein [Deltaproteobacteria bacterium]|nr:GAF domain-containing protein [Deltaproteobacteria bacterium]
MLHDTRNVAIIGANKEGLALLPVLLADKKTRVRMIADENPDAMIFKLGELGLGLAKRLDIKLTNDPGDIKNIEDLDVIINVLQDSASEKFLESHDFKDVEKLGALSARLIWGVSGEGAERVPAEGGAKDSGSLLGSLHEIVDAVRLTVDRKELLSVVLKLATESTRAERGSIMLISREDGLLRMEIAKGMDEEVVRKVRVPPGVGISGKVARDGKPLLITGKATAKKDESFSPTRDRTDVKSAMCVPLIVHNEVIGVINVSSSESSLVFTDKDLAFLMSLAGLAAEVIQRSNEYEKMRVDAAKFTFWKEADAVLSSRMPLDKGLNIIAKKLAQIVPGLTCFFYIYDEDFGRLSLKASSIKDTKGLGALSLRPGEGIEGASLDAMKDIILVDRTEEGSIKRLYLSLPMVSGGHHVGAISGHIVSARGLSIHHESFLKEIRSLIADGVFKYRQGEKEKTTSREMFAVDEAGLEMLSMSDPARLLTIMATTPAAIIGAEGALLRIKHVETGRFQPLANYGLDDTMIKNAFIPLEKETALEVLRRKEPVTREFSEETSPYIRSILSLPLNVDGRINGVLTLFNKTADGAFYPSVFSKSDLDVLLRFAVYVESGLARIVKGAPKEAAAAGAGPAPLELFRKRAEEETSRARRFDKGFVLATIRIAGQTGPVFTKSGVEFEHRLAALFRKKTRNFDVVVKLDAETYGFLLLDTNEKVTRPLDAIIEVVSTDAVFHDAVADGSIDILYGFALFPRDGSTFKELFDCASKRERLNLSKAYDSEL